MSEFQPCASPSCTACQEVRRLRELMSGFVYTNVNEEGESYGTHDELAPALALLDEFPNDTVVITCRV